MFCICYFQGQPEKLSYKSSSGGTTPSSERKHELGSSTELQVDSADEVRNGVCVCARARLHERERDIR